MSFVPTFPLFPTLSDAITKTRKLTGSNNSFQITDQQIVTYMNSFYSYDLPAKFRSLKLKDVYTFQTQKGKDVYPFNSELYTTVEMPCYIAKRELKLYNDQWNFYGVNFNWQQIDTQFATGNGSVGPYNGQTIASPLIASINNDPGEQITDSFGNVTGANPYFPQSRVQNILISANVGYRDTINVTDDGNGNLIEIIETNNTNQSEYGWSYYRNYYGATGVSATPVGTINYETGQISNLYFSSAIPAGTPIQVAYNPKTLAIPQAILFFQNQFTLAPTPDAGYTVEVTCYRQPIKALMMADQSGNPELSEWWEILAVGAAKKIFEDRLDTDGVMFIDKMLKERYDIIESRTYAQVDSRQIYTIYSDQVTYNYSQNGFGAYFGGP